jgi:histidyl-tRNA synthetase
VKAPAAPAPAAYLIGLGLNARLANLALADQLRAAGIPVDLELEERSFKAQLRGANKSGAALAVVRGDSELEKNIAIVKNMADGEQTEISADSIMDYLKQRR